MPNDPALPPAPSAPAAPKATREQQDKRIKAYVSAAGRLLTTAANDAEIRPVLEAHGYDAAEFAEGFRLQNLAAAAFGVRQEGIGEAEGAVDELHLADTAARDAYAAFREVARAAHPRQSDRDGLGLTGDVPHDLQRFITAAHASYVNAGKDPWKAKMTKRGYPAARLTTLLAAVDALTGSGSDRDQAIGDAEEDTAARDLAYTDLKEFMKELTGTARGALRGNRGALSKLKL